MFEKLMAWQRLLLPLYDTPGEGAGGGTGTGTGRTPPPAHADDEEEEEEEDAPNEGWKKHVKSLRDRDAKRRIQLREQREHYDKELKHRDEQIAAAMRAVEELKAGSQKAIEEAIKSAFSTRDEQAKKDGQAKTLTEAKRSALLKEGVEEKNVDRVLRLLDDAGISVDDAGAVKGIDEAVAKIKTDFAALFKAPSSSSMGRAPAPSDPKAPDVRTLDGPAYLAEKKRLGLA